MGLPIDATSSLAGAMDQGGQLDPQMLQQIAQAAQAQRATPPPDPFGGQQPAGNTPPPILPTQTPQQQPPRQGGTPLLFDYIRNMIKGTQYGPSTQGQPGQPGQVGQPGEPVTRGDMTLNFMGQFLSNLSQGLAQAGHGPGANLRGAAGAMQAPYQRELQQYQLQQQQQQSQAQIQAEQARTQLTQAQTEQAKNVVMTPYGPMNQKLAEKVFPAAIRKEGMENVADTKATSAEAIAAAKLDPIKQQLTDAFAKLKSGDTEGFKTALGNIQQATAATKAPAKDNEISLIQRMNAGDPKAKQDWQTLQAGRVAVRGATANMRPMTYYDPELQRNITMAAGEAEARQKAGQVLLPSGPVPATTLLQMQRAQNAIPNAVEDVSKNLKAWDNSGDRAIFARVIRDTPEGTDPSTWFGSVLNQVAKEKLSDEGKGAIVSLQRLNESLGTLRAISGLPATAGSMMATRALMPGATTPDSKMAKAQLDQIKKLVEQETGVPFLGSKAKLPPATAPTGGAHLPGNPFARKNNA
jgi:hypothetical protein